MSAAQAVLPQTHVITLSLGPQGFAVDPMVLTATQGDKVHWLGVDPKEFSIEFENPFDDRVVRHARPSEPKALVKTGTFKYAVIHPHKPEFRLDPEIEVDPPPQVRGGGG